MKVKSSYNAYLCKEVTSGSLYDGDIDPISRKGVKHAIYSEKVEA